MHAQNISKQGIDATQSSLFLLNQLTIIHSFRQYTIISTVATLIEAATAILKADLYQ